MTNFVGKEEEKEEEEENLLFIVGHSIFTTPITKRFCTFTLNTIFSKQNKYEVKT